MRAALSSGDDATIYSEDDCGNTALHYAMYAAKDPDNSGGYCKFTLKWDNYRYKPEIREERDQSAQQMVVFLLDQENKSKSNLINMVNMDGWAPLNYCVEKNLLKTVKTLIEKDADVNTTPGEGHEHHGDTPLINASANDHFEMAKLLLEAGADVTMYEEKRGWTALQNSCWFKQTDVVKMILERIPSEKRSELLNIKDEEGEYPLTYAVANGLTEIIPNMLACGASLYKDKGKIHNIDKESFRRFLDEQITVGNTYDKGYSPIYTRIELNYRKLDRSHENQDNELEKPQKWSPENVNLMVNGHTAIQVMEDMVEISPGHKELLQHPMCKALLRRKWRKLEFLYNGWMFIKVLFLCLLITISCIEGPILKDSLNKLRQNTTFTPENTTNGNSSEIQASNVSFYYLVSSAIVLVFMILIELIQIGVSLKWWASQMTNWFQILISILCTVLLYDLFKKDPTTSQWDLHILGLLLPMVFYELLREAGYHPALAKYVLLLDKVSKTFLKYGFIYAGLVITPAISFYLMTGQHESVYPVEFSKLLAKTVVMFVGEVELFDVSESLYFKWIEIGFFLCFIFFLAVVLMNLLNALAIVDTKDLMDDAEMEMLSSLLETVSFWENLKLKDPHKKYSWSFLSWINAKYILTHLVPDFSNFYYERKVMKIIPYDKNYEAKNIIFPFFSKIKRMYNLMKADSCVVRGRFEVKYFFGEMGKAIVLATLEIVKKREKIMKEAERINTKEKETEEQIKRQEEWNRKTTEQINTLMKFMENKEAA